MQEEEPKPIYSKRKLNNYLRTEKYVELVSAYIQSAVISGDWHVGFHLMPKLVREWLKDTGIDPFTLNYKDLAFSYKLGCKWETETAQKIASFIPYAEDWQRQINEIACIIQEQM